jgi:ankyrin repeat protein
MSLIRRAILATPLHVACIQGHTEIVKVLIDRGANLFTLSEGDAPIYDGSPCRT